jgi:phospholipase C
MRDVLVAMSLGLGLWACSGNDEPGGQSQPKGDGGSDVAPTSVSSSSIEHLVVIVQENHSFDSYFGRWCTAPTGSSPTCNSGPSCCEAGPDTAPGSDVTPVTLDDTQNGAFDPNHTFDCNALEINGGAMDQFVSGSPPCTDPNNFAYADPAGPIKPYVDYATRHAMADMYFQPVLGASSSNDMYFARAGFVFEDNTVGNTAMGSTCGFMPTDKVDYPEPTIADLLIERGLDWGWYGGGYDATVAAVEAGGCPTPEAGCHVSIATYPCIYDPTDVPFQYYPTLQDDPAYFKDVTRFTQDVDAGALAAVSFVKAIGYETEHPGFNSTISEGVAFVQGVVDAVLGSATYRDDTLVLLVYDEGGGYFDHVPPPPTSTIDNQPYGVRTVFMALGPMAKTNYISHVTMEHSSIVKFIEWNWLGGETGQLGNRDTEVNNIGDLLDPAATGAPVPAD